jgi:hypothetical protein
MTGLADLAPQWDIPSLPIPRVARRRFLERALDRARREGMVLPFDGGVLLSWPDLETTAWLRSISWRGWWCGGGAPGCEVLKEASRCFRGAGVEFAAVSAWKPLGHADGFRDAGASIHAWLQSPRGTRSSADGVDVMSFGDVSCELVDQIMGHIRAATWHDRHAREPRFSLEQISKLRVSWARESFEKKEGILITRQRGHSLLGYLMVPIDRTRVTCGGPAIAGLAGVGGSLEEGHWHYSALLRAGQRCAATMGCLPVVQFQAENRIMKLLIERGFDAVLAARYDNHWWPQ